MTNTITTNIHCACGDRLQLERQTKHAYGFEGAHIMVALELAGAYLGWRKTTGDKGRFYCPKCCADHRVCCSDCARLVAECRCEHPSIHACPVNTQGVT